MAYQLGERVNIRDLVIGRPYILSSPNWNARYKPFISRVIVTSKERVNIPEVLPGSWETYRIHVKPVEETENTNLGDMMTLTVEHWENNKFYEDKYTDVIESIKKQSAKNFKDIAMGELRAMPGAVDYKATEKKFGKGLKTRKRIHRLKRTQKKRKSTRKVRLTRSR
jgi:hypothetical protein